MVWLNKRATNRLDGDLVIARKFALQWSGPYLYKSKVNDNLGEIVRQKDSKEAGSPFRVHLSKLCLYREPEAYPGQYTDLFKPGHIEGPGRQVNRRGRRRRRVAAVTRCQIGSRTGTQDARESLFGIPAEPRDIEDETDWS